MDDALAEQSVRSFYDDDGWTITEAGRTADAERFEDLRGCAADYVAACRRKVLRHLPRSGERLLDAGSGPVQFPEYLEYSAGFDRRVCVDISRRALDEAERKLGQHGEYVLASVLELPLASASVDAIVSLHTIYHVAADRQADAVRELLRVAKPGARVVVVYANPDRLSMRIRSWAKKLLPGAVVERLKRRSAKRPDAPLYYHAHPLGWWQQFEAELSRVEILPWRSLTGESSRRVIPNNPAGKMAFRLMLGVEDHVPGLATRLGAYPMVVMTK